MYFSKSSSVFTNRFVFAYPNFTAIHFEIPNQQNKQNAGGNIVLTIMIVQYEWFLLMSKGNTPGTQNNMPKVILFAVVIKSVSLKCPNSPSLKKFISTRMPAYIPNTERQRKNFQKLAVSGSIFILFSTPQFLTTFSFQISGTIKLDCVSKC